MREIKNIENVNPNFGGEGGVGGQKS